MKEELKTLKDLIKKARKEDELSFAGYTEGYLKAEAMKWVKEDIEDLMFSKRKPEEIVRAWMYRLNITEEDLK